MYKLSKKIKVSDPCWWYGESEITVEMWHDDILDESTVRIMFLSIDDFIMYRDFNEWDLPDNWEWCKTWFWDKLPSEVNYDWLCEHGYVPF